MVVECKLLSLGYFVLHNARLDFLNPPCPGPG